MTGLPASGKSSLARAYAAHSGWPVVDRDAIRAQLFPGGSLAPEEKAAANKELHAQLSAHLRAGRSCIADGRTWAAESDRAQLQQLAADCDARLQWVWLDCPVDLAIERVEADRQHPGRDARAPLVREVARRWERPASGIPRLDASLPEPLLLAELLGALRGLWQILE